MSPMFPNRRGMLPTVTGRVKIDSQRRRVAYAPGVQSALAFESACTTSVPRVARQLQLLEGGQFLFKEVSHA
jgi:hypothetical protein